MKIKSCYSGTRGSYLGDGRSENQGGGCHISQDKSYFEWKKGRVTGRSAGVLTVFCDLT